MWSARLIKFRNFSNTLSFARCLHFTAKRPALYLYNSSTRAELFLIGTDHVCPRSAELVNNLITDVRPNVVAVELCERRAKMLLSGQRDTKSLGLRDFLAIKGSLSQKLLTYVIRNMYADLACTGLKPGEELKVNRCHIFELQCVEMLIHEKVNTHRNFQVALEQGKAVGATISLMDQGIDEVVKRAAQSFHLRELWTYWLKHREIPKEYPNFFKALSYEDIFISAEAMLKPEALKEVVDVGERFFPGLVQAILHDRNEHMVKNLRSMKGSIVGVVGALHVSGMQKLWQQAELECGRDRALPVS